MSAAVEREIPWAPGAPLIGNALNLIRDPLSFFAECHRRLGPLFWIAAPGRRYLILAGVEANRFFQERGDEVFVAQPVYAPYTRDLKSSHVPIAMDGEGHRHMRKAVKPGFSRELLASVHPQLIDLVSARASAVASSGLRQLRVLDYFQRITAEMMGLAMAGCGLDGHFETASRFAHTFLGAGVGAFPEFLRYAPKYRRARRRFLGFLRGVLDHHRNVPPGAERHADLVDLLLDATSPEGELLGEEALLANTHPPFTNTLVYAAAACGFLLYELLRHPPLLAAVRREVDAAFADGVPEASVYRRMPTLHGALLETYRMHPIALSIPRVVAEPFEFAGYRVPRGAVTLTATAVSHFDPELFPEPDRFDVQRYLPSRSEHRQRAALVPFGLGNHTCLAAGAVDLLISIAVSATLRHLDLAVEPGAELKTEVRPFPQPHRTFTVTSSGTPAASTPADPIEVLGELVPDVTSTQLAGYASRAAARTVGPGGIIIREGDPALEFFIVRSGRVAVLRSGGDVVAHLRRGDYFGEIGILQGVPRTATVRAETAVELIVLDRDAFVDIVADSDLTSREIAEAVRRRVISNALAGALPSLSAGDLAVVSPSFHERVFTPGEVIIHQGDPPRFFYVIRSGMVDVVIERGTGDEIPIDRLTVGDYFGEIGLLHDRPRTATVRATADGPVEVIELERGAFERMMEASAVTGRELGAVVAERLAAQSRVH